jgi:SulP family sulfate permease
MGRLERLLPPLAWGRAYGRDDLAGDLLASLIVTVMLIPQSLAYAMLAGLPPHVGLYASILPLIGYALFGSSRTLAVGPVAVISLMTLAAASEIAPPGSPEFITAALLLALLSGLILLAMGLARLGFLANLLSHPVISGFISASALLIAASQLKHLLGVKADGQSLLATLAALAPELGATNWPTLLIGLSSLAFLFWVRSGLKPLLRRAGLGERPADMLTRTGPVVAVVLGIAVVAGAGLDAQGVRIVGEVPEGLPPLTLPSLDAEVWRKLLPSALLISLVGFVESVSVAHALAAKRRQSIDPNQELLGLGTANLAAAFSGGYPVTGGFARSVVNFAAGAQTPLAGVMTAGLIALAASFLTPLLFYLPNAVLAATIVVAVLSLVDLATIRHTWRYSKTDFAAMAGTMLMVLAMGVEAGITTGVAISVLLLLWHGSRPHFAVVGQVPGTEHFRNVLRHEVITSPRVLTVRVDESLLFTNSRWLEDMVNREVAARPGLTDVVLMCPAVNRIDATALESMELILARLQAAGIRLHLSEVKGPVMDRLARTDLLEHLTGEVFLSQHAAMARLDPDSVRRAAAGTAPPYSAGRRSAASRSSSSATAPAGRAKRASRS